MIMRTLSLSGISKMSAQAREAKLRAFREAQINGDFERTTDTSTDALNNAIHAFEQRYKISSDEMAQKVRSGALRETQAIGAWLMLVHTRDQLHC